MLHNCTTAYLKCFCVKFACYSSLCSRQYGSSSRLPPGFMGAVSASCIPVALLRKRTPMGGITIRKLSQFYHGCLVTALIYVCVATC